MIKKLCVLLLLLLAGGMGIPRGVTVVVFFAIDGFLVTWYDVARFDYSFVKDLEQVSALYTPSEDGSLKVLNKGYDRKKREVQTIEGRGVFVGDTRKGALKVSFFGPFYASYNIIALDKVGYRWAMVCGRDPAYFWILSKAPQMEPKLLKELVIRAKSLGFDTEHLHYFGKNP